MQIPVIYASDVATLFSAFMVGFGVFWGIKKSLHLL